MVQIHPGAIENMHAYRALLDRELGVSPSPELVSLVQYARRRQERARPILASRV